MNMANMNAIDFFITCSKQRFSYRATVYLVLYYTIFLQNIILTL